MTLKAIIKKGIIISVLVTSTISHVYGQIPKQQNQVPTIRERLFFGGNFGLQFGTTTYIEVSPTAGIWLLPRLAIATGPIYKFLGGPDGNTDVYGGKFYSRFVVIQDINKILPVGEYLGLFIHAEYESLSYKSNYFYNVYNSERFIVDGLLAGFGISRYFGPRSSVNFSILWVLNETEIDVYNNPEFRIGFTF